MSKLRLATLLGYLGLIPFFATTAALFSDDPSVSGPALFALLVYAAVVLSFLGAIHWGLAMAWDSEEGKWQLALSVIPALLAWMALLLPAPHQSFIVLFIAYLLLLGSDIIAVGKQRAPDWYARLRIPLTICVCGCLGVAIWHYG